tara:strand:- start:85 stop:405 length:321 start_codon:yes stop_codon:yes gene_type:complete
MSVYIFLIGAIIFEVIGTLLLPITNNFTKLLPTSSLVISYLISFYFLTLTVHKLPLAIVYSSWSGLGVFSIAILSYFLYGQTLSWQSILGLFLIIVGTTLVNVFKV